MSIFLSGSLAYDYIMDFPDRFQRHLLPDQLHVLSVCFGIERLQRGWGGTAGNIAYAMQLLGTRPLIASAVGSDGGDYLRRLESFGLNTSQVLQHVEQPTASAHIITDQADNQITAFFSGPLHTIAEVSLLAITESLTIALICPNPKQVMRKHLEEAKQKGVPAVFDPGQQITTFTPDELRACLELASIFVGNDYEVKLLSEYTGWSEQELIGRVDVLIKTLGEQGSVIHQGQTTITIPPCPVTSCLDPTGAGDAWRAGFFVAYERGLDLLTCGHVGSVAAAYAVETRGTQEYTFTLEQFAHRYVQAYHAPMPF